MMSQSFRTSLSSAVCAIALAVSATYTQAEPIIKDGDVVEIIGDSITEGRNYSSLIETYLLLCQPTKVRTMQFGWSGERVPGLNARLPDFMLLKPNVVTLCYGMNDGRYTKITDEIRKEYRDGLLSAVEAFKKAGVKVVVGSPGCVDNVTFNRTTVTGPDYNENLSALRDEAEAVAKKTDSVFTDVFTPMINATEPAKDKYGRLYAVAGNDGVHPGKSGGVAMAYAFLKGLGFEGDVGSIAIDLDKKTALTTGRHEVVKFADNALTLTSSTYPFCFTGDAKTGLGTIGLVDIVPFNQDLSRFTLKVTGPAKAYKVTWGNVSKEFDAARLKDGINLGAEFLDNPFVEPFTAVLDRVNDKQTTEKLLLKDLLRSLNASKPHMPGGEKALDDVAARLPDAQARLSAEVAGLVKPVTHTISLEPIQ